MYINININFKQGKIMTRKGKLNWVKKHVAINTLQKWVFDKLRKHEKRFGSDLFSDMLAAYMETKLTECNGPKAENFYLLLMKEFEEKQISKTAIHI